MRYLVLVFLCSIAVIAYIQRTGVNAVKKAITFDLDINTEDFGTIGSAWLVGYALMQVPSGWLADRFGSRVVLVVLAILWSLLTGALGICTHFWMLLILWFVMGMALAGIFPCAAKSIGAWFPDAEKAMASGLLGSATMLGGALGVWLTAWLVVEEEISWQATYVVYGGAGVLWAIAYFAVIPERTGPRAKAPPMRADDWRRLFGSVSLWLLCGQQFFRAGAMIFFINWFPSFLQEARGVKEYDAGVYAFWVGVSAMLGGVCGGFFSDWLLRRTGMRRLSRQGIAVAGMTTAAVLVGATYLIADNSLAIVLFGSGAFIATFGGVSGYTVAIELGGTRIGTVFSMMNMCGNFGGAIVNFAAGSLTQRTGSWHPALFVVVGVFLIDAICWGLLNPPGPLFEEPSPPVDATGIRAGDPSVLRKDDHATD